MRLADPQRLAKEQWPFDDPRLPELLFRYRARNFPETLSAAEQQAWWNFCRQRLSVAEYGAPNTLENFDAALAAQLGEAKEGSRALLEAWQSHARQLRERYSL
ncbi:Exodeoxyribonuclease I [compost metagenome]